MKIRAWQVNKIKKMVRLYEPSKEYLEKCLVEMAEKSNKEHKTIAILKCDGCGIIFEKKYSQYNTSLRKTLYLSKKNFHSLECSKPYNSNAMFEGDKELLKIARAKRLAEKYY